MTYKTLIKNSFLDFCFSKKKGKEKEKIERAIC